MKKLLMIACGLAVISLAACGSSTKSREIQSNLEKFANLAKDYGTPISVVIGLATYITNENWKRRQYVEQKIKDFESQPETINVKKMLNTELQCIELFPFLKEERNRFVLVKDSFWAEALLESNSNAKIQQRHDGLKKDEHFFEQEAVQKSAIRDNFNRFLNNLQEFEKMSQAQVVNKSDLNNYLQTWVDLIMQVDAESYVDCPVLGKKYSPREALVEYMGLIQRDSSKQLSAVQRDVKNLIESCCSIKNGSLIDQPKQNKLPQEQSEATELVIG